MTPSYFMRRPVIRPNWKITQIHSAGLVEISTKTYFVDIWMTLEMVEWQPQIHLKWSEYNKGWAEATHSAHSITKVKPLPEIDYGISCQTVNSKQNVNVWNVWMYVWNVWNEKWQCMYVHTWRACYILTSQFFHIIMYCKVKGNSVSRLRLLSQN